MINTVKLRKSGNSLMFPVTKEMREASSFSEGDKFTVELTENGFVAQKADMKRPKLVFPMSYEQLIAEAKPDDDNLLPEEDMKFD